jgi:hypothetical protein
MSSFFLARYIERLGGKHITRHLQKERGLPYTRVAPYKYHRAAHDAATQDSIEFFDSSQNAVFVSMRNFFELQRTSSRLLNTKCFYPRTAAFLLGGSDFLDERIPLIALGAFPYPPRRSIPAGTAHIL